MYGQVIASVGGFAFLSFGVVLAYYGKIRIRWSQLVFCLAVAQSSWADSSFDETDRVVPFIHIADR